MNISGIDAAVRGQAVSMIEQAMRQWMTGTRRSAGAVLAEILGALQPRLGHAVASVRWWLSPYHWLLVETNRSIFGQCNNPSGHGHNYKLEAVVSVPLTDDGGPLGFARIEQLVDEHVIRRFDHKHLNLDTEEFARLIPSVEHIARICHETLEGPVAEAGGRLERVTVWETDKTACTYPASASTP
jgi:6-pyruvoyltetrahydropterin/6-carboxytetrahydropterin synthase